MIGIIDYGVGNVKAFLNVYERLSIPAKSVRVSSDFIGLTKLILPGVGAFDHAINSLNESGLRENLEEAVCKNKVPILGICVGMQMLADSSEEGKLPGLGWIKGTVKKFKTSSIPFVTKLPHMGWNTIKPIKSNQLLSGLDEFSRFYFLHSYYFECQDKISDLTSTVYGSEFTSAVNLNNVFGVQFHPEKSHSDGIKLLNNFYLL